MRCSDCGASSRPDSATALAGAFPRNSTLTEAQSSPLPGRTRALATWPVLLCRLALLAVVGTCAGVPEADSMYLYGPLAKASPASWAGPVAVSTTLHRLRGGSGLADLAHPDAFTRDLEKKLGGRTKAKKSLASTGLGALMDDLDQITETITSTDAHGQPRRRRPSPTEAIAPARAAGKNGKHQTRKAAPARKDG